MWSARVWTVKESATPYHGKEDDRLLRGRGEFVADIRLPGMRELAFVRSPLAHARICAVRKPAGAANTVFTVTDLAGVQPIVANSGLPGFKTSVQPVLAQDKVRYVGEPIAVCVADSRAAAEDLAAAVEIDFDELAPIVDMRAALTAQTRVHDHWHNNVFLETFLEVAPELLAAAPIAVRRRLRTARQCMSPIEGRGVVATWDRRLEQLLLYTSTQIPHLVRTGLAGCLGLEQARIRVVAPDVGGGFGYKGLLLAEEVCAAFLARRLGHPVRWIEDRREQLTANANCREHDYDIAVLCGSRRHAGRHRRRGRGGCRRLLCLSVFGVPGSSASGQHPARSLCDAGVSLPHLLRRDQQAADPAVSRRRPRRRLLRDGS